MIKYGTKQSNSKQSEKIKKKLQEQVSGRGVSEWAEIEWNDWHFHGSWLQMCLCVCRKCPIGWLPLACL